MARRDRQIRLAYRFFCEMEREKKEFTVNDIAEATGWSLSTIDSYRSKKWYFILDATNGGFTSKGVCALSEDAFVRLHAQRVPMVGDVLRPRYSPTVDSLVDKSRESALLGVQIYNNPLLAFRAPGFIVQIVISYVALFHAIFERDGVEYWYKDENEEALLIDGDKKCWELSKCIDEYYCGQNTPVTENLKLILGLRNKVEHRFLPPLDIAVSGFCQAALMNYEDLLVGEFGQYFTLRSSVMLALQLTEYSYELDDGLKSIQSDQYEVVREYIHDFSNLQPDEIVQSPSFSFRAFLIPKIGNHASSSDVAIEFIRYDETSQEDMETYEKQIALIKVKRVQVADQGKLLPSAVIEKIEEKTGIKLRMYDHTQAWKYYRVRTVDEDPAGCDTRYCQYSEPFRQIVYTPGWVDFLSSKIQDPDELVRIRAYR